MSKKRYEDEEVIPPCVNGGFTCMPYKELEELLNTAAKKGAEEVLKSPDLAGIKGILAAWQSAGNTIWKTLWNLFTYFVVASVLYSFADNHGLKFWK